jgi:hypothetical protein
MRFQHFTPWLTEKDLGQLQSTPDVSKHWTRLMNGDPDNQAARLVEEIFEEVRQQEYPLLPSRKNCVFLFHFGVDPDAYARSISLIEVRRERHLVEVVCDPSKSIIARVDKSLLTSRFSSKGELNATREQVILDAKLYWKGTARSDHDAELLVCGEFKYSRIIRKAEDPLDERPQRFRQKMLLRNKVQGSRLVIRSSD